jgi:type VI secretion system protein ImpE
MTEKNTNSSKAMSLTLHQLNAEHCLESAVSRVEEEIRLAPTQVEHRWTLVESLCLMGDWERAMRQLQTVAKMDSQSSARAHLVRGLVRAEAQRTKVFAGQLQPTPVIDTPQWMAEMAQAISLNASEDHDAADILRQTALAKASVANGVCSVSEPSHEGKLHTFEWLSDSDSRLGPICEVMVAGGYRWLPFADIRTLKLDAPKHLLDLLWAPVTLTLSGTQAGNKLVHGFIPVRYCGTEEKVSSMHDAQRDALLLSRMTRWCDVGQTGVFAKGQKTLMSDCGDFGILDVREIQMHSEV